MRALSARAISGRSSKKWAVKPFFFLLVRASLITRNGNHLMIVRWVDYEPNNEQYNKSELLDEGIIKLLRRIMIQPSLLILICVAFSLIMHGVHEKGIRDSHQFIYPIVHYLFHLWTCHNLHGIILLHP